MCAVMAAWWVTHFVSGFFARHGQHRHELVQVRGFIGDTQGRVAAEQRTGFGDDRVQHGRILHTAQTPSDGPVDLVLPQVERVPNLPPAGQVGHRNADLVASVAVQPGSLEQVSS
jgi:hypothetical protein